MHPRRLNQRRSGDRKGQYVATRTANAVWWVPVGLWARREFALLAALVVAATAIWGFAELAGEVLEGDTHASTRGSSSPCAARATPPIRSARAGSRS